MKRLTTTILLSVSLATFGCSSDATSPDISPPGGGAGAGSLAGAAGSTSLAGSAGVAGVAGSSAGSGGASGGEGGSVAAGSGGDAPTGAGAGGMASVTVGITGPVTGALTSVNSTWGPGAVSLTGPVTIPAGLTLTISHGTHVTGAFPITAAGGTFKCDGTFVDPVTIFSSSIALTGGSHAMKYCIVNSQADTAVDVNRATLSASHIQIQRFNVSGVHVHGAGATAAIDFSTIGSTTTLFTADAVGKESVAVLLDADAAMGKTTITNSVLGFLNNPTNTGLKILGASNTHLAYDNISGAGSTLTTSDAPTAILTKDPGIADIPNLDHNLAFYSPDLDQADPAADFSAEPAPNGGRANLGYYGGTSGARITSVQIISPNGCEPLAAGMTKVSWNSSPNTGPKTLEVSVDGGTNWAPLAKVAAGADTGSMMVTLPSMVTDQAKIRFSQDNDPTHIVDVSDRVFAIGKAANAVACANLRPACTANCKPFKVICYTGYRDGQMPTGQPGANEPTKEQVVQDLTILAPYTHGIRTYGSNPLLHDGGYVPGAADALNLDLHMGIWIDDTYTNEVNMKSINDSLTIIAAGHKSIKTVIVSNEYLLRVRQSFGDTVQAEARLVGYIKYVRSKVPAAIPVVIGESYPDWLNASKALYDAVDVIMWHVHPWWEQKAIAVATNDAQAAHEKVLAKMKAFNISKPERLAETGYPWGQTNGPAQGSEASQAQYLHDINQYSLKSGLEYWFFEGFDESWKGAEGSVGAKWGMWTTTRTPHPVVTSLATLIPAAEGWTK